MSRDLKLHCFLEDSGFSILNGFHCRIFLNLQDMHPRLLYSPDSETKDLKVSELLNVSLAVQRI